MNSTDEKNDEVAQEDQNESEAFPENSDDLAQEKRETNEFNAKNNTGHIQYFIQNAYLSDKTSYKADPKAINTEVFTDKSYNLSESNECTKFVEEYKDGEYLALAIILCTFEVVSLGDLPDLISKLMEYLPETKVFDNEGNEIDRPQQNPYLSLNSMLAVIGGERFITEDGQRCTGFGEGSKQAFINIWEQFPSLRNHIVSWLIHLSEIYEYRTSFDAYQITTAFARVVSMDFIDAKRRIFPRLYSNPNNSGILGALAYELYGVEELKEEIKSMVTQWAMSDSDWLWKSACLVYSYLDENHDCIIFEKHVQKAIGKRLLYFSKNDLIFIAMILCCSNLARLMLPNIFYTSYNKTGDRNQKIALARVYISLVRYSYYMVDSSLTELPLVACDTKEQQHRLTPVISQVMSVYNLRRQLYAVLDAYLKEISNYHLPANTVKHLSAYFHNMASSDVDYRQDIMYFLQNCQNNIAQQIFHMLRRTYSSNNGGLLV